MKLLKSAIIRKPLKHQQLLICKYRSCSTSTTNSGFNCRLQIITRFYGRILRVNQKQVYLLDDVKPLLLGIIYDNYKEIQKSPGKIRV